ncbi:MAG: nickel pincer cofactor biosynthesis protein LarB [Methanomassiliicoccales archaeon]
MMKIREILDLFKNGRIDYSEAENLLRLDFLERISDHTLFDHAREARRSVPEVIFGEGKTPETVSEIVQKIIQRKNVLVVSKASQDHFRAIIDAIGRDGVRWERRARLIVIEKSHTQEKIGLIGILAAGTSDIAVAEEAKIIAEIMGCEVMTAYDVGIAGFLRFTDPLLSMLRKGCDAIIVVAGMEGALASVVSSLVDVPVIGVPTSVGYGMGGSGHAALLSMLQSCSPGIAVVNIDNGIGAGAIAALISLRARRTRDLKNVPMESDANTQ